MKSENVGINAKFPTDLLMSAYFHAKIPQQTFNC